jgi:hypothetical protein
MAKSNSPHDQQFNPRTRATKRRKGHCEKHGNTKAKGIHMITPPILRARREALGVSRELLASFCPDGVTAATIRTLEKGTTHNMHQWHLHAIEQVEGWFEATAPEVISKIVAFAHASTIEGQPVLWFLSDPAFRQSEFFGLCLERSELHKLCLMEARAMLFQEGEEPIEAEMLPDQYDKFREMIGTAADHPELWAKWWRHWAAQFKMKG